VSAASFETAISFETRRSEARRTQWFFREINNRVAGLSQEREVSLPRFICECLRLDCCATIVLPLEDYARVRSDPARFIVLAGHEDTEIQDVLERHDVCVVVRNVASTTAQRPRASTRPTESRMSR
jgi:hypothetical protein